VPSHLLAFFWGHMGRSSDRRQYTVRLPAKVRSEDRPI
jgi:hypothetical protein